MTPHSFRATLADDRPPEGASLAVQALWWAARGDWDRAHGCAQDGEGQGDCDWVHAYLHRVEGDLGNAGYWYRQAGRPVPAVALDAEWEDIARALLSDSPPG